MPRDAEASPPDSRVVLPGGKGVQVGDGNEQVNQFIATYVERQVVVAPARDAGTVHSGREPEAPVAPARMPTVWNVPGRLNTFTGRAELLDDIARVLAAEHPGCRGPAVAITALRGLGGVGKTQLAVEYAWRHAAEYSLAWWMDAEEASLLPGQVAALGARLGLPSAGRVDQDAASVLDWLAGHDGWLVIFDNAVDLDSIRAWIPPGSGHVIITSRHPSWAAAATRIDVDVLTRAESVSFLTAHVRGIDAEIAGDLAAELGDLPLALGQAAAYLEASDVPPAAYLRRFRQRRAQMLSKGTDLAYGGSVDTAWSMTLEKLQAQAPEAVALLELAAFAAPEPLPLSVFAAPAVYRSNIELRGLSWDRAAWWYSLITPAAADFRRIYRKSAASRTGCVSMSGGRCCRDWCGLWPLQRVTSSRSIRARWRSPRTKTRSSSSRRRVPMTRSQMAFILGVPGSVVMLLRPSPLNTSANAVVKVGSRSWDRNRSVTRRSSRSIVKLRACCTAHAPVGRAVTPATCSLRVPCSMNTSTYSRLSSTVSTTRKSQAMIGCAWAARNSRHVSLDAEAPDRYPRRAGSPTP